jgi:hypothetical protein
MRQSEPALVPAEPPDLAASDEPGIPSVVAKVAPAKSRPMAPVPSALPAAKLARARR